MRVEVSVARVSRKTLVIDGARSLEDAERRAVALAGEAGSWQDDLEVFAEWSEPVSRRRRSGERASTRTRA